MYLIDECLNRQHGNLYQTENWTRKSKIMNMILSNKLRDTGMGIYLYKE